MPTSISTLSYVLRKITAASATPIGLGHAHQLVAAALGYKSLAAYHAAIANGGESPNFDVAKHVVLNQPMLDSRATDLNIEVTTKSLARQVKAAWRQCLPSIKVHLSVEKFEDVLREYVEDRVLNDESTSSELANTNGDGIDEVYVPFEFSMVEMPLPGEVWEFELEGHVSVNIDSERPYSGHHVDIEARMTVERIGLATFGTPLLEVTHAQLDYGWGDDEADDRPKMSLAEALAAEMGLTVQEAEDLVDAEPLARMGTDDMVYGYIFDFRKLAPPETARKILKKYQSLQVEVPPWFFDKVVVTA